MATYREELAWIHHSGFSEFSESAASGILELLQKAGIADGLIVEMGCGSGILARELTAAGFEVAGFDASRAMIDLARRTAPLARFQIGAFGDVALPRCQGITAIGEVLNYGTLDDVRHFVAEAARALSPGGLLLFDAAEPDGYPPHEERRLGGDDWSVIVEKHREGKRLTRRIRTFRQRRDEIIRDEETHTLELYDRATLLTILREAGFRVRTRRSYGKRRLPRGHQVYVCIGTE
ncbi:MAG TPA: class I SAM-dependent methyltransferase [Thermoanaerobaculia bacterium]